MESVVRVGVGVMVLCPQGVVLLKRQGSHGAGEWSFPGGHLEFGESIVDCARREVMEELGVELDWCYNEGVVTEDFFEVIRRERRQPQHHHPRRTDPSPVKTGPALAFRV